MSKFTRTTHSNDCPVCGNTSGNCRTKDDGGKSFVLCMTHGDAKLFDIIDGWKCVKPGTKGWATFAPDGTQPQIDYAERQRRTAQREAEKKAIYLAGLSPAERHCAHSQLLAQLPLQPDDRADLARRGLSAATIETFRSIEPWQALSQPVRDRTPGSNGRKLLSPYSGYLVPAKDTEGRITGFQIRNRNLSDDDPKYPWLSTTSRPANLQNGELPLTFAEGHRTVVNLTEGILKPMVAAERTGQAFIGASGGNFASSPKQLQQYLQALNPERVVLCPDGGAVVNRQVMQQYKLVAELVASLGYAFSVRWWSQTTKADGDADEITREQFEAAQLITWAEFQAIAPRPAAQLEFETAKVPLSQAITNPAKQTKADWLQQQQIECIPLLH